MQRQTGSGAGPAARAPDAETKASADASTPLRVAARVVAKVRRLLPSLPEDMQQRLQAVFDRMLHEGVSPTTPILQEWGQSIREQAAADKAPLIERELEQAHRDADAEAMSSMSSSGVHGDSASSVDYLNPDDLTREGSLGGEAVVALGGSAGRDNGARRPGPASR